MCSGIEAASVAWKPLGWSCVGVSEIDPFCCALLKHYYPDTPNFGDLNAYEKWPRLAVDILIGGTPCQDFSVAGQRAGMAGARGGLTMRFLDVVERFAPTWVVWENVPGVLSIDGGRDFGAFLGGLAKRGYGFAYRVLDAQYFGLAQRRERVFVVGCAGGKWQRAAAVLFDATGMRWDNPPSREAGKGTAPTISARTKGGGWPGTDEACDGCVIPIQEIGKRQSGTPENGVGYGQPGDPMFTIQAAAQHGVLAFDERNITSKANRTRVEAGLPCPTIHSMPMTIAHSLTAEGHDASEDGTGRGGAGVPTITFDTYNQTSGHNVSRALSTGQGTARHDAVLQTMAVRRLTPREVERLQGFPDDYTLIPYRGKPACDGPRYRALGNSMAVPVIGWLGRRIELVETAA